MFTAVNHLKCMLYQLNQHLKHQQQKQQQQQQSRVGKNSGDGPKKRRKTEPTGASDKPLVVDGSNDSCDASIKSDKSGGSSHGSREESPATDANEMQIILMMGSGDHSEEATAADENGSEESNAENSDQSENGDNSEDDEDEEEESVTGFNNHEDEEEDDEDMSSVQMKMISIKGWSSDDQEKLLHLVAKIFYPNFPSYVIQKHLIQSHQQHYNHHLAGHRFGSTNHHHHHHNNPSITGLGLDDLSPKEAALLGSYCDVSDPEIPIGLLKNLTFFCHMDVLDILIQIFMKSSPEILPLNLAHAMVAVINSIKYGLNVNNLLPKLVSLRTVLINYLCRVSTRLVPVFYVACGSRGSYAEGAKKAPGSHSFSHVSFAGRNNRFPINIYGSK